MTLKEIVSLWYKTYIGNTKDIQKAQTEFVKIMLRLYEELYEK